MVRQTACRIPIKVKSSLSPGFPDLNTMNVRVGPRIRSTPIMIRMPSQPPSIAKKKSGKKKSGGLNEKGRKSYEKENPGSDLKAPSKKVGNPRRKSFCARMKGMKAKLTSKKTSRDPDSRINKSLRAWNC